MRYMKLSSKGREDSHYLPKDSKNTTICAINFGKLSLCGNIYLDKNDFENNIY